jgi:hypothetical protein
LQILKIHLVLEFKTVPSLKPASSNKSLLNTVTGRDLYKENRPGERGGEPEAPVTKLEAVSSRRRP